jgi:hypothetical protein
MQGTDRCMLRSTLLQLSAGVGIYFASEHRSHYFLEHAHPSGSLHRTLQEGSRTSEGELQG